MELRRPLVLIGLDAFERTVLERLVAEGRLPHLGALLRRGNYRHLLGEGPGLQGASWRGFMTGRPLAEHGWFFRKLWRPETGRVEAAAPSWLPATPFWAQLDEHLNVAVIDVPHAAQSPAHGIRVDGWQGHDKMNLYASPPALLAELRTRFGERAMAAEKYGPRSPDALRQVCETTVAAAEQIADIGAWLQEKDEFDLFVIVLGSPHRAGHYLWAAPGSDLPSDVPSDELLEVYAACDRAVGQLVEAASKQATVAVFALHGMGPNSGWVDRFPEILRLLHDGAKSSPSISGWRRGLHQLRRTPLAQATSRMLPDCVNGCIGRLWSRQMHDWSRTRFFAVPDEEGGCVRVNRRGREPNGIIKAGAAYERVLDELEGSLRRAVDLETGLPIVRSVTRVDRLIDANAPGRAYLPDLIVEWDGYPVGVSSGVRVPGIGEVRWERGGRIASGRSGAHLSEGWLVVCDPAVPAGTRAAAAPAAALVPSLLRAMDVEQLSGQPAGRTFVSLLDQQSLQGSTAVRLGAA